MYRHILEQLSAAEAIGRRLNPRGQKLLAWLRRRWRQQRDDDQAGMAWWNALTEKERAQWMAAAGNTGVAKDAWEAFKRVKR